MKSLSKIFAVSGLFKFCLISMLSACGGGESASDKSASTAQSITPTKLFSNVTLASGIDYVNGYNRMNNLSEVQKFCGGLAVGDFDNDGLNDLFIVRGDIGHHLLYKNLGNNQYKEVSIEAGIIISEHWACGPTFADIDGDYDLDLFIGGIEGHQSYLLENTQDVNGNTVFEDVTGKSGLLNLVAEHTVSASFGDYNKDGLVDLFLTHWGVPASAPKQHLWKNEGNHQFVNVTEVSGLAADIIKSPTNNAMLGGAVDYSFSATFSDINDDGYPDILLVADYGTSQVFINNGDGQFTDITTDVIKDENGMGSAVGDIDNDGDLDWFVSAIAGLSSPGNRLYLNESSSINSVNLFRDVTEDLGVSEGGWAWAACLADFNGDGFLDIFHVNGWSAGIFDIDFSKDHSRLFLSERKGLADNSTSLHFTEQSFASGISDQEQGRGVSCFDSDQDGDVDILVVNNDEQSAILYRNNSDSNTFSINLTGAAPNTQAIGAKIFVKAGELKQMREVRIGSNFTSQNPTEQYFSIAEYSTIDELRVEWPDGNVSVVKNIQANQRYTLEHPNKANE